jgi:hypothetical protein
MPMQHGPVTKHNMQDRKGTNSFMLFTLFRYIGNQDGLCWNQEAARAKGSHCLPQVYLQCLSYRIRVVILMVRCLKVF